MIARHETQLDKTNIWSALAASLPDGVVAWRQDGRAVQRDGRWYARFVAYIDANTVRERLDAVVPGEWDLTLDLLPPIAQDEDGHACSFKARLQILGVIREDVGTGRDYKSAATDAFKRSAVRFGIAHELYAYEQNWVQVDGDGRYAKPLEDPQAAYNRRHGTGGPGATRAAASAVANGAIPAPPQGDPAEAPARRSKAPPKAAVDVAEMADAPAPALAAPAPDEDLPDCPKCGGRMWDNRASKRNPKAPDYKCRDRTCDGVIWPPKGNAANRAPAVVGSGRDGREADAEVALDGSPLGGLDDIPF